MKRVIRSQSLGKRRALKQAGVFLGTAFLFSILHVWTRVEIVQTGYKIRELNEIREELRGAHHNLKVEVATLRSPVRLHKIAATLSLKKPPEKEVTLISVRSP